MGHDVASQTWAAGRQILPTPNLSEPTPYIVLNFWKCPSFWKWKSGIGKPILDKKIYNTKNLLQKNPETYSGKKGSGMFLYVPHFI